MQVDEPVQVEQSREEEQEEEARLEAEEEELMALGDEVCAKDEVEEGEEGDGELEKEDWPEIGVEGGAGCQILHCQTHRKRTKRQRVHMFWAGCHICAVQLIAILRHYLK